MSHFNVSLIVWARSQDSVHKPQFLKRRERRAEADRTEVLLLEIGIRGYPALTLVAVRTYGPWMWRNLHAVSVVRSLTLPVTRPLADFTH